MFTGLIEETGVVVSIGERSGNRLLVVSTIVVAAETRVGDSLCVNGCCLTAVEISPSSDDSGAWRIRFDAVPETLDRTNLGALRPGDAVNLERSLRMDSRLGGHFVTGHIDGTAVVSSIEEGEGWRKLWFDVAPELSRQMAIKGSIAVDGISLTLVDVTETQFSVALIPHTLESTTIGRLGEGDRVNVETDLLAKYVQRQFATSD